MEGNPPKPTSTSSTSTTTNPEPDLDTIHLGRSFLPTLPHHNLPTHSQLTASLRATSRSVKNRLHSIHKDSQFVDLVHKTYGLPLVVNKRAGEWYVDPRRRAGAVYFKSTDGHNGVWGFSGRRLNLGLLEVVRRGGGAIIVDSTRRGKRYPDSLSKTIPIWCAVMNQLFFPTQPLTSHFFTPPLGVSPQEHEYIQRLIPTFVAQFKELGVVLDEERYRPVKPLRPLWVNPGDFWDPWEGEEEEGEEGEEGEGKGGRGRGRTVFEDYTPLVLVTASQVVGGEGVEGEYIQGAGDDAENWLKNSNLTPSVFWENLDLLLQAEDPEGVARTLLLAPPPPPPPPSRATLSEEEEASLTGKVRDEAIPLPLPLPPLLPILRDSVLRNTSGGAGTRGGKAQSEVYIAPDAGVSVGELVGQVLGGLDGGDGDGDTPTCHRYLILVDCCPLDEGTGSTTTTTPPPKESEDGVHGGTPGDDQDPSITKKTHIHIHIPIPTPTQTTTTTTIKSQKHLSSWLRTTLLPELSRRITSTLSALTNKLPSSKVSFLIRTPSPNDLSVAVALFILCLCFDERGGMRVKKKEVGNEGREGGEVIDIDKQYIRRRLAWITQAGGEDVVEVSRRSLVCVNACLMERRNG